MNGAWFDHSGPIASLPVNDRGLQYGDGLFETIAIRSGQPRLWNFHLERLHTGCARLAILAPPESYLLELLQFGLQQTATFPVGLAKIIVTRGSSARGYRYASESPPRILLGLFEKPGYPPNFRTRGVAVRICATRVAAQTALAGIKSLNRLEQVLARNEWQDNSISEGLMLNDENQLVCGTMTNVFVVRGSKLQTPPLIASGVAGVMRRHILAVSAQDGLSVTVEPLPVTDIQECTEMFICNSQFGIWPVRRCASTEFIAPGAVTAQVISLLALSGIEECSP